MHYDITTTILHYCTTEFNNSHHNIQLDHCHRATPRRQGAVTTACVDLGDTATLKCGVWEHNVGVSIQENDDEVFVVLAGTGVIRFDDGTPDLVLAPGVVGRLLAGKNRRWEVTSAFRKIWIVERGANCL